MRLTLKIKKVPDGYQIIASNGDMPQEGYINKTRKQAVNAIDAMYGHPIWDLRHTTRGASIKV